MDEAIGSGTAKVRVPWHLWTVGIGTLLWNAIGGYTYIMTQLRDPAYLERSLGPMGISLEQANAWLDGFPAWVTGFWAIGVWGSVLGSILLLARLRRASWAFAASFAGAAINFAYEFTHPQLPQLEAQPMNTIMPLVIVSAIALQWWYARAQTARRVLR